MKSDLVAVINRIQNKKIVVIGDMVADVYLHGTISRISREAPVLVLTQAEEKVVAGGAGNVVHNIATLGGSVWAVGLVGRDTAGTGLKQIFTQKGVNVDGLLLTDNRPTITKTRIIAGGSATVSQQVVRIDREPTEPICANIEVKIMSFLDETLNKVDGVVISDYGSGTLTDSITKQIIAACKQRGIPSIVDSRYNIGAFTGIDYVKQNDAEASANVGFTINNEDSLLKAGAILLEKMKAKGILITRGEEGMTLFEANGLVHNIPVSSLSEVYDVSGAGDTCVAAMILSLAAGVEPAIAAKLSNIAAGIAVRKLGTATVSAVELKNAIGEL
jgi:rfaE bifunctional protein kinase chain/domain